MKTERAQQSLFLKTRIYVFHYSHNVQVGAGGRGAEGAAARLLPTIYHHCLIGADSRHVSTRA